MKRSVWPFLDIFMLLCIAFLISVQTETKESNASARPEPKIHIFIEKTEGGFGTKCNGRYVETNELYSIIRLSSEKGVEQVHVVAMIEENIPYGYVDRIKTAAQSASIRKTANGNGKGLLVVWDSRLLTNFQRK